MPAHPGLRMFSQKERDKGNKKKEKKGGGDTAIGSLLPWNFFSGLRRMWNERFRRLADRCAPSSFPTGHAGKGLCHFANVTTLVPEDFTAASGCPANGNTLHFTRWLE